MCQFLLKEIMPFAATRMQLEMLRLSEVSQKEKDKYHKRSPVMWDLKYGTNKPITKQRQALSFWWATKGREYTWGHRIKLLVEPSSLRQEFPEENLLGSSLLYLKMIQSLY